MEVFCACALLALMVASVSGAPISNITATTYDTAFGNITVAPQPRGRGTYGIVFSSTATFAFCVWTAVHPNVITNAKTRHRFFYKIVWMIISVVIPEGIIICAFGQRRKAKELHDKWCKKWGIETSTAAKVERFWKSLLRDMGLLGDLERLKPKDTLGMEGAFFVVMGGFIMEYTLITQSTPTAEGKKEKGEGPNTQSTIIAGGKKEIDEGPYMATLTPEGFLMYLESGHIHQGTFDKKAITDKGKTSNISKLLTGAQALWFIVQCIARWASGFQLTLLEVHVGIQVVCTIVIFTCWYYKPLNVNEPIRITLQKSEDLPGDSIKPIPEQPLESKDLPGDSIKPVPEQPLKSKDLPGDSIKPVPEQSHVSSSGVAIEFRLPGDWPQGVEERYNIEDPMNQPFIIKRCSPNLFPIVAKACYDIVMYVNTKRWRTRRDYSGKRKKNDTIGEGKGTEGGGKKDTTEGGEKGKKEGENSGFKLKGMFAEAILVSIMGALHAAAWNTHFPTAIECFLWRLSSLGMCVSPLALVLIAAIHGYQKDLIDVIWVMQFKEIGALHFISDALVRVRKAWDYHTRKGESEISRAWLCFGHFVMIGCCFLLITAYFGCIAFITVESYISIRNPPKNTFMTPVWSDYWPHL